MNRCCSWSKAGLNVYVCVCVCVCGSWSKAGLNEQQLVQFVHRLKAKRMGGGDVEAHNHMQQPGFLQAMPNVMMSHHHMYNNRVGL